MKQLKILGLLAVVVASMMGVMASNAFAVEKPEGLTETITAGTGAVTAEGVLTLTFGGSSLKCLNTLTANVAESGAVSVSADTIDNTEAACALVKPTKLPWEGKVCELKGSPNTMWLYINATFSSPFGTFAGWIKTQVDGTFSGTPPVFTSTKAVTLSNATVGTSAASLDGELTLSHTFAGTTVSPETKC
jgi:hypothetical protein